MHLKQSMELDNIHSATQTDVSLCWEVANGQKCDNPGIKMTFIPIDYDQDNEYIDIYYKINHGNETFIKRCTYMTTDCYNWRTCIDETLNTNSWINNNVYQIILKLGANVHPLCQNHYLYSTVTISCFTPNPTFIPTITPTNNPSETPSLVPSNGIKNTHDGFSKSYNLSNTIAIHYTCIKSIKYAYDI